MTLIEIMVVVTILGMIAGMIGVAVMNQLETAKKEQACSEIKIIEGGLDLYKLQYGDYPGSDEGLDALVRAGKLKGKGAPKDPWKHEYIYIYPGANNPDGADIYSYGADGKQGGTEKGEDLTNWSPPCIR